MQTILYGPVTTVSWTEQFVKEALQESEEHHTHSKLFSLFETNIPISLLREQPELINRAIFQASTDLDYLSPTMKKTCIRALRTIHPFVQAKLLATDVHSLLSRLVFPTGFDAEKRESEMKLDKTTVSLLKRYIETGSLPQRIPLRSGLLLMAFARSQFQTELRNMAFSRILEAMSHRYDTLDEWCFLLGIAYLDSRDRLQEGDLSEITTCFNEELSRLKTGSPSSLNTIEPYQKILSVDEWISLLTSLGFGGKESPSFLCMGPIRPSGLREFLAKPSLSSAFFRALLRVKYNEIILRFREYEDITAWNALNELPKPSIGEIDLSQLENGAGVCLKIRAIEVSHDLAQSIGGKDTGELYKKYSKAVRTLINYPDAKIMIGLCGYPGVIEYPGR